MGGQGVQFLAHREFPVPSPAVVGRIGDGFRAMSSFADTIQIPMIRFGKCDREIEVMRPHLARVAVRLRLAAKCPQEGGLADSRWRFRGWWASVHARPAEYFHDGGHEHSGL